MQETNQTTATMALEPQTTSRSETGHAVNMASYSSLVLMAVGWGTVYNPSRTSIKLPALQAAEAAAKAAHNAVSLALANFKNATAAREVAFKSLATLASRAVSALMATDTASAFDENAQALLRKIRGTRSTPKISDDDKEKLLAQGKSVNEISSSQMGFDNRIDNFDKLVKLLTSIALYVPNENDLKVAALNAVLADLRAKNSAVMSAQIALANARNLRNDLFYKDLTGICDLAVDVKTYIKSVYGASSAQYKMVTALKFRKQ
jgi:hypothetical protein